MEPNKYPTSYSKCKKHYDSSRIPIELPCGHSFCEECLREYYTSEKKFLCFSDDKTFKLNLKDLPIPNYYLFILKQSMETPNKSYMCSKHKNEPMKFICEEYKDFLCCLCIWDHAEHKNSTKIYLEEYLLEDIKKVEQELSQMKEMLDNLK